MSRQALAHGRRNAIIALVVGLAFAGIGNVLARRVLFLGTFGGIIGLVGVIVAGYGAIMLVVWLEAPRAIAARDVPDEP